jgi:fructose/tagatose bisphosphate aldolase
MQRAWHERVVVPAYNVPFLPMMEPTVRALRDARCFGLIAVARLEWVKFGAKSPRAIRDEYERVKDERFTRLHLDHVPAIDEDGLEVDAAAEIAEALALGYESVMVDGSRLDLADNIAITREAVEAARAPGAAVEGELGAILGHEPGPLPPYEELFASGRGFTDPDEAARFVDQTQADWLSVAVGSFHGSLARTAQGRAKPEARLDIAHLRRLAEAANIPLVLHGGTGIRKEYILQAVQAGVAKMNIATATRRAYLAAGGDSGQRAQDAVYQEARRLFREELQTEGTADRLQPAG